MDVVLALLVMAMPLLALVAVITPLVAMIRSPWGIVPAVLLYLMALGMLVAWVAAANAHMDWADRTGGQGNAFAGAGWLLGALAAAVGATYLTITPRRPASSA